MLRRGRLLRRSLVQDIGAPARAGLWDDVMRTRFAIFLVSLLAVSAFSPAARAQDGPSGIGVVIAPENGIWSCSGSNPDTAFSCARQKCKDAGEIDCYRVAWCYPGGWGAMYSVRTAEFHSPNAFCGAPSREEALATVERWCRAQEYVVSCYAFRLLTPDGGEEEIETEFTFER
jgi:hypothetical protein